MVEPGGPPVAGATFEMVVSDVFSIKGRGTVVTGLVAKGYLRVGEEVTVRRADGREKRTICRGIETFKRTLAVAREGSDVGLLLEGLGRDDVQRGDVVLSFAAREPREDDGVARGENPPLPGVYSTAPGPVSEDEIKEQVLALLRKGEYLRAISLVRNNVPGLGLKEGKDYVDRLARENGLAKPASKCFIASAVCGEESAEVLTLRAFRDRVMMGSRAGRVLALAYYRLSPPVADGLRRMPRLRRVVRAVLVRPLVKYASRRLRADGDRSMRDRS